MHPVWVTDYLMWIDKILKYLKMVFFSSGMKRSVLSAATASTTRRLPVHQAAGEIVNEWVKAAIGAG